MEIEVSRLSENCLCITQFHSDDDQTILITPAQALELVIALQSMLNIDKLTSIMVTGKGSK